MRWLLLAICTVAARCMAEDPPAPQVENFASAVTTNRHDMRDTDDRLIGTTESVSRGKDRIMVTAQFTGQQPGDVAGSGWRTYYMHDKPVMMETFGKGGSTGVIVRVYGNDFDDFEVFKKHADGSVTPVSSEELDKLKQEQTRLSVGLGSAVDMIKKSVDAHTNVDEAAEDVRKQAHELRKALDQKLDKDGK